MRLCVLYIFVLGAGVALAKGTEISSDVTAFGYLTKYGIPRAEQIRQAELQNSRIVGGLPAAVGQYPSQAGLIGDIVGEERRSVCGGSLITTTRVVTAAHCWSDGVNQVWRLTVVLGSDRIFSGGTRVESSAIATHPNWSPTLARNDVAVIYLATAVTLSTNISPVALPTGSQIFESYVGEGGIAVGYGLTSDGSEILSDQSLNHVRLNVISNSVCTVAYPLILQTSHICTSGLTGVGVCSGDSGGPLLITRDGNPVLIGIASFVSSLGCEAGLPSVFSRVTSFLDFINSHIA